MLRVLTSLPDGLLTAGPRELHKLLGGPTLIHLPGRHARPLFASVLLHGNETAGFEAAQTVLRKYAPGGGNRPLPRSLSLFIGNVAAAEKGLRRLEDQPDFNRIWPGAESGGTPEHAVMAQVLAEMQARNVFASIDLHQNTGINPHYGCVNRLQPAYLHLARLFSRTVVYFRKPKGVQSMA
ncbi:MAG: M14 family metallopeptidase, partial [Sphingomonadales bacterium]|nr:M14 family metallopeptidase [Sphingomonadales bacterium]